MKKFIKLTVFVIMCLVISVWGIAASALDINVTPLDFDMDLLYGRNVLEKMENGEHLVDVYDTLLQGIQTAKTDENGYINITMGVFDLFDIDVTLEEVDFVLLSLRYDNPQLFWWDHDEGTRYSYFLDGEKKIVTSLTIHSLYNTSTDEGKAEFDEAKNSFKEAADNLIKTADIKDGMSEYEISLLLHDAVVKHVDYKAGSVNDHSAYGALIEKQSVCEGYAELYQYLLYLCGIQSHAVTGDAGGPHMWNLVRIDGEYYMSDPTHSEVKDKPNVVSHEYFNVTAEKMRSEGRTFDDNGYELPDCTATKANYYNHYFYNMSNFKVQPNVENAITQLKYNGEARFHYNGSGTYTFDDFYSWAADNDNTIAKYFGLNSWSLGVSALKSEFVMTISGIETIPLPEVANIPNIAAICSDTGITVKPNSAAGDVVICPVVLGTTLSATDIQDILNNTAVEVKELVNGKVVTGSKLDYCDEEAIIAVKGDIDLDGELSVFDANIAQKGDSSFTAGYELQKMVSDIDGNEITDATDAQAIIDQIVS